MLGVVSARTDNGDGDVAMHNAGLPEGRSGAVGVRERVLPQGGEAAVQRDPPAQDVDVHGVAVASALSPWVPTDQCTPAPHIKFTS